LCDFDNYRQRSVNFFALSIAERIPRQNEKDRQLNSTICCRMSLSHSLMRLCTAGVDRSIMCWGDVSQLQG
jgi:hypothetical protein